MLSIQRSQRGYIINGRAYSSISDVLKHFNVEESTALKLLESGFTLNEILLRNKNKTYFTTGFAAIEKGLKHPSASFIDHNVERNGLGNLPSQSAKFSLLKDKNKSLKVQLNEIHKFTDCTASEFLTSKFPNLLVCNLLPRMFDEVTDAVLSRWGRIASKAVTYSCDVHNVIHGCFLERIPESYKLLLKAREADLLVLHLQSHVLSMELQASLGTLLRQRYNQAKTTIIFMTTGFYYSLLEIGDFLKESFSEYGQKFKIIEANPSFKL